MIERKPQDLSRSNLRETTQLLDETIMNLEDFIVRFDQHHFPGRAVETRLDKFIGADQRRKA